MISSARYFLFRERPFRVLAMHGRGFVEPPRTNKRDSNFHVWWFTDEALAKRIAHSCDRDDPIHVAEKADFLRRSRSDNPPAKPFVPLPTPKPIHPTISPKLRELL